MTYQFNDIPPANTDEVEQAVDYFEDMGFEVH